jgi:predicted  nucleic acid-binding Zn-ribbon protein
MQTKKAALESTLYRCRALVGRIGEELRKKKPEHFVDERSLADLHASLERAAWVLEQTIHTPTSTAKGLQEGAVSVTAD